VFIGLAGYRVNVIFCFDFSKKASPFEKGEPSFMNRSTTFFLQGLPI